MLMGVLVVCWVWWVGKFVVANQRPLQLVGSAIMLVLGYFVYKSNPVTTLKKNSENRNSLLKDFMTSFLLTLSNASIVLLFVGLYAHLGFILSEHTLWHTLNGLFGILAGASLWWGGIVMLVSHYGKRFNIRAIRILNRVVGIAIILFAIAGVVWVYV